MCSRIVYRVHSMIVRFHFHGVGTEGQNHRRECRSGYLGLKSSLLNTQCANLDDLDPMVTPTLVHPALTSSKVQSLEGCVLLFRYQRARQLEADQGLA